MRDRSNLRSRQTVGMVQAQTGGCSAVVCKLDDSLAHAEELMRGALLGMISLADLSREAARQQILSDKESVTWKSTTRWRTYARPQATDVCRPHAALFGPVSCLVCVAGVPNALGCRRVQSAGPSSEVLRCPRRLKRRQASLPPLSDRKPAGRA